MNRPAAANPIAPGFLREAISLRLALLGFPLPPDAAWTPLLAPIFARELEQSRRLAYRLSPTDARIQKFLADYLAEIGPAPNLPQRALALDQPGLARGLSLPADGDRFTSALLSSYRLRNGILHNPANDRRTTAGVFHIAEGGLPIPDDKKAVPKATFARLLALALTPPEDSLLLPYTAGSTQPVGCFVSLLLRPLVVPARTTVGLRVIGRKRQDGVHLTLDGQARFAIPPGCLIEVRESGSPVTLLRPPESDNFHNLAEKLNWGV